MASMTRETPVARFVDEEEDDIVGDGSGDDCNEVLEVRRRVSRFAVGGDDGAGGVGELRRRVSRFGVDGGSGSGGSRGVLSRRQEVVDASVQDRRRHDAGCEGGRTLPPPHAWLAVEETKKSFGSDNEDQWARLLQRGSVQAEAAQPRRSSFSVVRRERAAREAWLDRAWEMKKSWHERNGGAPDADTPVVVVVGKQVVGSSSPCASSSPQHHSSASVAMDMEEVRACRDLGLELPSDGTVEIQCYGISASSSPTHSHASSGADSPSTAGSCSISSPSAGEDPVDVKARLKVWAQAVALASTTRLGS
ncbi:hypothetical protein D1007_17420 [Hordeum vulgare]|nr:hypothetical protein D1007_17420 [Hordeum vulgare]KAI5022411.1 hypothetical protein ZWY2020_059141 [Hordeum vulgare]